MCARVAAMACKIVGKRAESRDLHGLFYGTAPMSEREELKVFVTAGESICGECGDEVLAAWRGTN